MSQPLQEWISTVPCLRTKLYPCMLCTFPFYCSVKARLVILLTGCCIFPKRPILSLLQNPQCLKGMLCLPSLYYLFCLSFGVYFFFIVLSVSVILTTHVPVLSLEITHSAVLKQLCSLPAHPFTSYYSYHCLSGNLKVTIFSFLSVLRLPQKTWFKVLRDTAVGYSFSFVTFLNVIFIIFAQYTDPMGNGT